MAHQEPHRSEHHHQHRDAASQSSKTSCQQDSDEDDVQEVKSQEQLQYEADTINKISAIKKEVEDHQHQIEDLDIQDYRQQTHFGEFLLQCIIKLDNIETRNNDKIKEARREAVIYVQSFLNIIDMKAHSRMELEDSELNNSQFY